jgi:hypothetical protein
MGICASGDHDDGNIARLANVAAEFESIDARKHDVNQYDIGWVLSENGYGFFAARGFVDDPAFVLECKFDRGANPLVVFNG